MAFWVYVDVGEGGLVSAQTYPRDAACLRLDHQYIRIRRGTTVSQALRSLAAAMVTAKAETIDEIKTA